MILRFLIDSSGSMSGEPLRKVHEMLVDFIKLLHKNIKREEKVLIQMLSYNIKPVEVIDGELSHIWTRSNGINLEMGYHLYRTPYFEDVGYGPKNLGEALKNVNNYMTLSDLLVIFTQGGPSDILEFKCQINKTKNLNKKIIIFHGKLKRIELLSKLTDNIFSWDIYDPNTLYSFLENGVYIDSHELPLPPKVIELTIL